MTVRNFSTASLCSAALLAMGAGTLYSQDYPTKPIRIVVGSPGGGGSDTTARQAIPNPLLGQRVIIDNRGGIISIELAARAQPDGYTLLIPSSSSLWLLPFLREKVSWDPIKDFLPVSMLTTQPYMLVVTPSLPAKSVKELIALAKAKPGEFNYSSVGIGSGTHLASELFNARAGINVVHVFYKTIGTTYPDLMTGQTHIRFSSVSAVTGFVNSGKLKGLAITGAAPSALAPGMPTMTAAGVPGFESIVLAYGLFAPAKTPGAVIDRLNKQIVGFLSQADVKAKLFAIGVDAAPGSPQQLAAHVRSEMTVLGKVIKDAGIRDE